jgi:hypothetical protein
MRYEKWKTQVYSIFIQCTVQNSHYYQYYYHSFTSQCMQLTFDEKYFDI